MADSFTSKQVLGVLGRFRPVLDYADVTLTAENVVGVLGQFKPVLDEAASAPAANTRRYSLPMTGVG